MPKSIPEYFSLLNESDQAGYSTLQIEIRSLSEKYRRGLRVPQFAETLAKIRAWAQRCEPDDWKRCLVCGLYYLSSGIAVNSHQLKFLTKTCKSAINGTLRILGYTTVSARGDVNADLVAAFPFLQGKTHALRQWSLRRCAENWEKKIEINKEEQSDGDFEQPEVLRPSEDNSSHPESWAWSDFVFD
jgi:hypothetical protein